ncbi:MAG: DUF1254 domain-containing protein [Arenicellales bacterium]
MKTILPLKLALAGILLSGLITTAVAETTQDTYLGKIEYQDQTITKASAAKLNREIDLQRASQLTLWAMPITSFYQSYKATNKNLGLNDDAEPVIGLYEGYDAVYPFLTANVTTPYTISGVDLSATGPLVVNIPAGSVFGVANNAWQEPIKEIGSGIKESLLFVGPGQEYPKDFKGEIIHNDTFMLLYFYRVLGVGAEAEKLKTAVTAYKLSDAANPPKTRYVSFNPKSGDDVAIGTQPIGMEYWELVNEYVQKEPMADRDRFFYAWLRDFGIEKGKSFNPTAYQKEILLEGVKTGMAMAQATAFNKTKEKFSSSLYGTDSGWEDAMAGMDPKIDLETYSMFNERTSYTFEAVTTSAGMVSRVAGEGSAYLGSYYDADGNALMGGNNYSLHIEPNPPAANFWSITVYDIANRLIIRNETRRSDISSRSEALVTNSDGSVDLFFGPEAPKGKENNWIQTNKDQSFFVYLRLYGPEQEFFDQTYLMNKIEKIK